MTLKQLRYFCRVYELNNMTHAAEALHLAQSALSQQIQALESDLNAKLFQRHAQGVSPTGAAKLLYQHAQRILRQFDATRSLLTRESDELLHGRVSLGMASSTARILALPLIAQVHQTLPGVVLEIVDVPSADLGNAIVQGRLDFALSPDQARVGGIQSHVVVIEELFLLAHPKLHRIDKPMSLSTIQQYPMMLPSQPNQLRARIDHAFLSSRLSYTLLAEASTGAILIPAVEAGMAVTILPYSAAAQEIEAGTIQAHAFAPALFREISLCWSSHQSPSHAAQRVMQIGLQTIATLIATKVWQHAKLESSPSLTFND